MTDLIFDANSLWARSFFAAQSSGFAVSAVMTAMRSVIRLIHQEDSPLPHKPDRILFAWDDDRKNKKKRADKPPNYHEGQIEFVEFTVKALGAAHAIVEGYEADDVLATAVLQQEANGNVVIVVSGDKDLEQLQSKTVYYWSLNKKEIFTREAICKKWNVKRPIHVALALAVQGDPVDDIKGVPRFGKAKVEKMFEKVTSDMKFSEARATIRAQVPDQHLGAFDESLELTLLNTRVPDVIEPTPIVLTEPDSLPWPSNAGATRSEYTAIYCLSKGQAPEDYYMKGIEDTDDER